MAKYSPPCFTIFLSLFCEKRKNILRTIQLDIPDDVNLKDYDISMIVAAKLYEDKILSTGQAAKVTGLSKRAFIELLQASEKINFIIEF